MKLEDLRETQSKADVQLLEQQAYLNRREREHQKELDRHELDLERQLRQHSDLIGKIIKREKFFLPSVSLPLHSRWEKNLN